MHELSIASSIIDIVNENLSQHPGARATKVKVAIGSHCGVVPESLRFCFPLAAEGTPAENAQLLIEEKNLMVKCQTCNQGPAETPGLVCPHCGSFEVSVTSGMELDLISIEIKEETLS